MQQQQIKQATEECWKIFMHQAALLL